MTEISLTGSEALAAKLSDLPKRVRRAVSETAMIQIGEHAAEQLKQNAPENSGALKRSITHKTKTYKSGKVVFGIAGAELHHVEFDKRGKKVRPAKYIHLPELGTKKRQTKAGANRGSVTGLHFIDKTQKQVAAEAEKIFTESVLKEIGGQEAGG
jgi:HK97 gp10 family phage protein